MKDDTLTLLQMQECIERVRAYTADGEATFLSDGRTQDAVVRNLEVLGEAAKRISPDVRTRFRQVPWRRIAGLRDVLIHQYERVDLDQVWRVVERDVPDLERSITAILAELEP